MDKGRGKRIEGKRKEKLGPVSKKKNDEEKKTQSEFNVTHAPPTESDLENIAVVGKSCNIFQSKSRNSGYKLHECPSETVLNLQEKNENLLENVLTEVPDTFMPTLSCTSFISAKSDLSNSKSMEADLQELEDEINKQSFSTLPLNDDQLDEINSENEYLTRLKEMKKEIILKEKKIEDLNRKVEESNLLKKKKTLENRDLTHQINLLSRQLQSVYEFMGQKDWAQSTDADKFATYRKKAKELELLTKQLMEDKETLQCNIHAVTSDLNAKERDLNAKNQELIEYKNKSTLEMCKLVNEIDCLKESISSQSQIMDNKFAEAQNSMDDEIVRITTKLEEQYQIDLKAAIKNLHSSFERLSNLPASAINKLLQVCQPNIIDWINLQGEWNFNEGILDNDPLSPDIPHASDFENMKDTYEKQILFLKNQVQALTDQLMEKKNILDIYETELMSCKGDSATDVMRSHVLLGDMYSLKDLYATEIFSQKKIHSLELHAFEEKVKNLSEEILYRAKNEENFMQELNKFKKMAYMYREKYENLVFELEEKVESNVNSFIKENFEAFGLDDIFDQIKSLINCLKKVEEIHEGKMKELITNHNNEIFSYQKSIEVFKTKIMELELFQNDQLKLDTTIQELIENVGNNYIKTVEAMVTSHVTELSLKQLDMYSAEKRYLDEMTALKSSNQREVSELQERLQVVEKSKSDLEKELDSMKNSRQNSIEMSVELLKYEGVITMKEETELALQARIKNLEEMLQTKEENCKKELKDLIGKLLECNVLSSAKDDLIGELEEKLSQSENLLEKSQQELDNLYEVYSSLEENLNAVSEQFPGDKGDYSKVARKLLATDSNIQTMQTNVDLLKHRLLDSFRKIDSLERDTSEVVRLDVPEDENVDDFDLKQVEEEKNLLLEKNQKLQKENSKLLKTLAEKDKVIHELKVDKDIDSAKANKELMKFKQNETEMKVKLQATETEKGELLKRMEIVLSEKLEVEEKNKILQDDLKVMNEKMEVLVEELNNGKMPEDEEMLSISLQEVRVLYEEEATSSVRDSASASWVACTDDQCKTGQSSLANDGTVLKEKENWGVQLEMGCSVQLNHSEDIIYSLRKELEEAVNEKNKWMNTSRDLERENECLKMEIRHLREENSEIRKSFEKRIACDEVEDDCAIGGELACRESKMNEMKLEMRQLGSFIKTLSTNLDIMKANNERLLNESMRHLRNNQNLTSELEEAWAQRYEIEDQLTNVRRENALLNLHRAQLEDTNRRISNLVSDGAPSAVSWMKIHETVENIVDEVLALKTSVCERIRVPGHDREVDSRKMQSELKLMSETLHAQLQNKTILCDELMIQKETLEKELKDLEKLLRENDSRILSQRLLVDSHLYGEKINSDAHCKQSGPSSCGLKETSQEESPLMSACGENHMRTLNLLKKQLEDQTELEQVKFHKNLEQEIKELKNEVSEHDNGTSGMCEPEVNKDVVFAEIKFEEEVLDLMKGYQSELESLYEIQKSGAVDTNEYSKKVNDLVQLCKKKEEYIEKRYQEVSSKCGIKSALEEDKTEIICSLESITKDQDGESRKTLIKDLVENILEKYIGDLNSVHYNYENVITRHITDIESLKVFFKELKDGLESFRSQTNESEKKREMELEQTRLELEKKLEIEREILNSRCRDMKDKYESEIVNVEKFWADKVKESRCRCSDSKDNRNLTDTENSDNSRCHTEKSCISSEQVVIENAQNLDLDKINKEQIALLKAQLTTLIANEGVSDKDVCPFCSTINPWNRMDVETDDGKLEIIRERDALREIVISLRQTVSKLLNFAIRHEKDGNESSFFDTNVGEDTLYKSLHMNLDHDQTDVSLALNNTSHAFDITNLIQEINDHSMLNSSNNSRLDLEKCVKQVNREAAGLLALSNTESSSQLFELFRKIESEKVNLEDKVRNVEKTQEEIKMELGLTKNKLAQWERNIEVISEGYGEEMGEPKKTVPSTDQDKIQKFLSESCDSMPHELNLLEEICKEGYRLQEEWKQEKLDLQQQIDVADKQLHSLRKFMEEQATEREQERENFDKEINNLRECLKAKERDNFLHDRTNREVEALENQVKELTLQLSAAEESKKSVEAEFQNAVKKIWSLREVIQDLEVQLAEVNERESNLKKKIESFDSLLEEQTRANRDLKERLETCKSDDYKKYSEHVKTLEEECLRLQRFASQVNSETLSQLRSNLRQIEAFIIKKTKDLEQMHMSSTNVSCSSHSEDISIRDHLDATRCSTPDEMCTNQQQNLVVPLEEVDRLHEKLVRHTRAEEVVLKYIQDLKIQLKNNRKSLEELQTERDVLLDRADSYLKENSGLKARLEEQRCNAAFLQKQMNADLESQVNRLEIEVDRLNELSLQKDKQLQDVTEILENTSKTLKQREAEALNKSKEENVLVSTLKLNLENALNDKDKLEENLKKVTEKLRDSMKIPALIDSMIEEKNAEIDRLEKEVSRLSSERSDFMTASKNTNSRSKFHKSDKRIKFSEPDSFGECISSISPYNPSVMRNCSDSYTDFRNSSFRLRQMPQSSKLESLSSIGPLQLSPRGGSEICSDWKTSSPIVPIDNSVRGVSLSPKFDRDGKEGPPSHISEESSKVEIDELNLEIDILKKKLAELSQELETSVSRTKELQHLSEMKDEEIKELKNKETNLLTSLDTVKRNNMEEVEDLQNKLSFERGKVEKVYSEIRELEVKKIEIEEAFFSLKEDYKEKLEEEQTLVKTLSSKVSDLEFKNSETEKRMTELIQEMKNGEEESKEVVKALTKQITELIEQKESPKLIPKCFSDVEVQVDADASDRQSYEGEQPNPVRQNLNKLKLDFSKILENIRNADDKGSYLFSNLNSITNSLSVVSDNVNELLEELEGHRRKIMESSVDDLAIKVHRELLLSAKLDNNLLSSIQGKGFVSGTSLSDSHVKSSDCGGGGDSTFASIKMDDSRKSQSHESHQREVIGEMRRKLGDVERERDDLLSKLQDHQKIIKFLEESLLAEKERIVAEKDRCKEDARIMELLRVNLEKGLQEIKSKDKDLKKERQIRIGLEKELAGLRKRIEDGSESLKLADLSCQLLSKEEKISVLNKTLENEKLKNQELRLLLEQNKIERITEKEAQKLMESDFNLLKEQRENLKTEVINAKELLLSRDEEISLLNRKLNLQEIDILALRVSNDFRHPGTPEVSTIVDGIATHEEITFPHHCHTPHPQPGISKSLLLKLKKLNACVQQHVQESNEMGEALLHLTEETELMRDIVKKLEENTELKSEDDTLIADADVERKLWDLEKGKLLMDVETLRAECDLVRRESIEVGKNNDMLKLENSKLKAEIKLLEKEASSQIEIGVMKDRINRLMGKYLRAESYRKALAWQKQYFMASLNGYKSSEEEAHRRMGKYDGRKRDIRGKQLRFQSFRIVALAVVAIFRMKFIVKRWQRHRSSNVCAITEPPNHSAKVIPIECNVMSLYNDPVNPLAYQTHNLFRRSSSRVLRSPPSRDPGLQSNSISGKKTSGCLEPVRHRGAVDAAKILP